MDSEEQEGYLIIKKIPCLCVCLSFTEIYTFYPSILISYFKGVGDKIKELILFLGFPLPHDEVGATKLSK